ncbi:hypothetical protein ACHAXT_001040 [Thalassiosira profunda]
MSSRKRTTHASPLSDVNDDRDAESLLRRSSAAQSSKRTSANRAKILVHKICLMSADQEGIVGLLQDIVIGIVLGTLGMSVLLSLDYAGIINLETARVLRKTASEVFNDLDMMEGMEEELEMKILSSEAYTAMKKELLDSQAVMEKEENLYNARTAKVATMQTELGPLREEYDKLMKESGLSQFCPDCHWAMKMSCQQRVDHLLEQYSDSATTIGCIANLVKEAPSKNGRCLKPSRR